jgi:hypothetical protein
MLVQDLVSTAGPRLSTRLPTFEWSDDSGQGSLVTEIVISDMESNIPVAVDTFSMPADGSMFNDL